MIKLKISEMMQRPSVRVLLFMLEKGEVKHADLLKLIESRGTLSRNLRELDEEGLVKRRVVTTKPIQAYYSLTEKGVEVAKYLSGIKKSISI